MEARKAPGTFEYYVQEVVDRIRKDGGCADLRALIASVIPDAHKKLCFGVYSAIEARPDLVVENNTARPRSVDRPRLHVVASEPLLTKPAQTTQERTLHYFPLAKAAILLMVCGARISAEWFTRKGGTPTVYVPAVAKLCEDDGLIEKAGLNSWVVIHNEAEAKPLSRQNRRLDVVPSEESPTTPSGSTAATAPSPDLIKALAETAKTHIGNRCRRGQNLPLFWLREWLEITLELAQLVAAALIKQGVLQATKETQTFLVLSDIKLSEQRSGEVQREHQNGGSPMSSDKAKVTEDLIERATEMLRPRRGQRISPQSLESLLNITPFVAISLKAELVKRGRMTANGHILVGEKSAPVSAADRSSESGRAMMAPGRGNGKVEANHGDCQACVPKHSARVPQGLCFAAYKEFLTWRKGQGLSGHRAAEGEVSRWMEKVYGGPRKRPFGHQTKASTTATAAVVEGNGKGNGTTRTTAPKIRRRERPTVLKPLADSGESVPAMIPFMGLPVESPSDKIEGSLAYFRGLPPVQIPHDKLAGFWETMHGQLGVDKELEKIVRGTGQALAELDALRAFKQGVLALAVK